MCGNWAGVGAAAEVAVADATADDAGGEGDATSDDAGADAGLLGAVDVGDVVEGAGDTDTGLAWCELVVHALTTSVTTSAEIMRAVALRLVETRRDFISGAHAGTQRDVAPGETAVGLHQIDKREILVVA